MKKTLLSTLLLMLLSVATFAAKEDLYALYTGFEDGAIPEGWIQENVSGQTLWAVEKADTALYPSSAVAGDYRLLLRNNTEQTQRFITRLITPVMDLREVTLPVLMFSHAQQQRTGDVDTLRVYYRSTAESRWVLLATYPDGKTNKYPNWTDEIIDLPAQSATYQLAFEGIDNFGRGIALDEIIVRPMPTCDVPTQLSAGSISTSGAVISWLASMDADSIEVVVATAELDPENIDMSAIALHKFTPYFNDTLIGLKRNTTYYWYVNSYCSGEVSGWAGSSFRTRNLASIPYTQQFNLPYAQDVVNHMAYMTQGTSILRSDGTMEYMPFVNQNTNTDRPRYSYDSTSCYVFAGGRSVSTAIPAGEYVYGTTPELDVDDISKLTVSFWGSAYTYVSDDYESAIIVGVMANPDDYSTFVPVDTFRVTKQYQFAKFTCDLAKYKGDGKYVALSSDFKEKKNLFYVDNLEVNYSPAVAAPEGISISAVDYNKITVNVADLKGADSWNLVVASDFNYNGKKPSKVLLEKTGLTGSSFTIEEDTITNKIVQVYVQAVKGGQVSAWSLPEVIKVPGLCQLPYELPFSGKSTQYDYRDSYSNYVRYISSRSTFWDLNYDAVVDNGAISRTPWYYSSGPAIVMSYVGEYIALPAVKDLKNTYVRFSFSPYYSSEGYVDDARLALGVMTDPLDFSTFDSLAVFDGTGVLVPRQKEITYAFDEYKGEGKYIAFKYVLPKSEKDGNGVNIYFANVYSQGECPLASSIQTVIGATDLALSWKGETEQKYIARIIATKPKSTEADTIVMDSLVTGTSALLEGLKPHTSYYYNVGTKCPSDTTWGTPQLFTTNCLAAEPLPYVEGFESYASGANTKRKPDCWNISGWSAYAPPSGGSESVSYYPYIYNSASYVHGGSQCLVIGASSTSSTNQWLALPVMDAEVNTLQMSFWLRSPLNGYNDTIFIGLQPEDAKDLSNFEQIAYVIAPNVSGKYYEYIVRFDGYQGTSAGKRLTFLKRSTAQHYWYIDDIKVEPLAACAKITDVDFSTIGVTGATVKWTSETASEWEVIMATKSLDQAAFDTINKAEIDSAVILVWERVTTNPYVLSSDLANVNTTYYVYVRGICDGQYGYWSNEASFATLCSAEDIEAYTENFQTQANASCWTMGVRSGTSNAPSFNTNGYLYIFNTTSSDGAYAVMPPMDTEDISQYQISFDAHGGTGAAYLKEVTVGIVTNAADLSTFEAMNTLSLNQVAATSAATNFGFDEAYRYTVRFSGYEGDWRGSKGNRVMFISESGEKANYVYVDNIKFNKIGAVLEPLEVWATEVGMDYAELTWDTVGTKYNVKVSTKRIDPETEAGDKFDQIVNGNGVRVEGLTMLTRYYVYIQTVGAESNSLWSNVRWFSTVCPPSYSLPYKNDFSGKVVPTSSPYAGVDCWQLYYDNVAIEDYLSGSSFYCRPYASANKAGTVTGDNGLYLGSTLGSTTVNPKTAIAVMPALETDLSKAMLEFDWKSSVTTNTESAPNLRKLAYGIATEVDSLEAILNTIEWLDTITTEGYIGTWKHEMLPLNKYAGEGKYIVLAQFGGNGVAASTVAYAYLDNVLVSQAPAVFPPASIECGKTFGSTAELSWNQTLGNYSQWQVVAVPAGEAIPENPTVQTFNATSGVFTGLNGATEYDFYVRAVDTNGQVSPWVASPATGTTLYLVEVADASWDFDDKNDVVQYGTSATYIMQKGWLQGMSKGTYSQSNVPYIQKNTISTAAASLGKRTSWYSFSGDSCLRFYSTSSIGSYAVIPQINCNLDSMQLRFKARPGYGNENTGAYSNTYAKGTYSRSVTIGYMTDPYDFSTFKEITTYKADEVTATKLEDDPEGTNFWRELTIPLYGVGEGKYLAFATGYDQTNYMYIDDVIVEKETGCSVPVRLAVDSLAYDAAKFVWGSGKTAWDVQVITDSVGGGDSIIVASTVNELAFTVMELTEKTNYTFRVRSNCGEDNVSDWVSVAFTTPCEPTDQMNAVWSFNKNLYQYGSSASYLIPECTKVGGNTTTQSNLPYAIANGTAATGYNYARTQENGDYSLRFYSTTSAYNNYIALPDMAFPLDSMTLHFWGRAAYFYKSTHTTQATKERLAAVNSAYLRQLIIGVMSDADDFNTFIPLDTITYDKVWSGAVASVADRYMSDDKTGNNWWQEYAIPLAKYAGKGNIAIVAPKPTGTSYFFLEDMEIVKGTFCTAASNVRVADLQSREATIAWQLPEDASDSVAVALYLAVSGKQPTDSLVEQVDSVIASHQYTFKNLMPGRDYYYAVKHYCSNEDESPWSNVQMFTCNYEAPFFLEDVSAVTTYPVDWSRGGNTSATGSTLADFLATGTVGSLTETATSNSAWRRNVTANGMGSGTLYSILSTGTGTSVTYSNAWLFSPIITLKETEAANMMLSFDMGMWGSSYDAPAKVGEADYFMVLVSSDGGKTWSEEKSWKWAADGTGDFDYNEVINERRTWYIDLTEFVGKNIKMAFYAHSQTDGGVNTGNRLYLDNFQLNAFTKTEYDEQICRWNDYADAAFTIDADDLIVGETTAYDQFIRGTKLGVLDKLTILNLTVGTSTTTTLEATRCEGGSYEENGFAIYDLKVSNKYSRKLVGVNTCDSIVELNLTVTPTKRVVLEETICQGSYYEFNGVKYYTNTTLSETFTAADGCDSVVSLYLTVAPILQGETEEVFLCPGKSYNFSEKYPALTEPGTYQDTIINARGCDSLISVVINAAPSASTLIRAAICQGNRYDEYPFHGLQDAGDWTSKLETAYGCDSIVTLHLMVATPNAETQTFELYDTISSDKLPYVLNGVELLPVGTERGVYTRTVSLGCGEATLVINVDNAEGVDDIYVNTLAVTPNPVSVGEAVRVLGQFSNAEVEVITATGAVAYRQQFTTGQITVPGIPVAGVYLVRLTDSKGVYHAKLVVK
ncbi:MAG: choice-of-anchor J domain-containing protein [Paludibacteraceae bacterium]|nr:choice-of-anchor J domain-containing protein [Paludibacteraceae bacterium]